MRDSSQVSFIHHRFAAHAAYAGAIGQRLRLTAGLRYEYSYGGTHLLPHLMLSTRGAGWQASMASRLPVSDHIERLTLLKLLDVVLLHPIGIYWYLHTLLLCYALLAVSLRLRFLRRHERYVVFLTGCLLANRAGMLSMTNALYFTAGVLLRQSSVGFCRCFAPSLLAVVPFALIACSDDVTSGSTLAFVAVVMIIMFLLFVYRHLRSAAVAWATFVGSHTLPILLFSPAFTFAARFYQPWLLALDPTGLLFLLVTLTLTCGMSIGLWLMLRQIFHARMRCMASRVASCVAKAVRRK